MTKEYTRNIPRCKVDDNLKSKKIIDENIDKT